MPPKPWPDPEKPIIKPDEPWPKPPPPIEEDCRPPDGGQ